MPIILFQKSSCSYTLKEFKNYDFTCPFTVDRSKWLSECRKCSYFGSVHDRKIGRSGTIKEVTCPHGTQDKKEVK